MSAAVLVESTQHVAAEEWTETVVPSPSTVLAGDDVTRERELDLVAANIEGAAEGLGIFLLVALFGVVFVIAALTGVLA